MCGITALLSRNNVYDFLYNSLYNLQNRGYDSAGLCCVVDGEFEVYKKASDDHKNAIQYLAEQEHAFENCKIGIGHTRWATHGEKNDVNSHPHLCFRDEVALVHNGIIENYDELRVFLKAQGVSCKSATDSEVVVNLISFFDQQHKQDGDLTHAIEMACKVMKGTWALVIISKHDPNTIYFTRNRSPLVVACTDDEIMITSEVSGLIGKSSIYSMVDEGIIYKVSLNEKKCIDTLNKRELQQTKHTKTPFPFDHWTLKEIHEQSETVYSVINHGKRLTNDTIVLNGLEHKRNELLACEDVIMLGCGTSLNAAKVVERYFDNMNIFNRVSCVDGAEFDVSLIKNRKTLLILISQSGETKDLHRCLEMCKGENVVTLGIVNVPDSIISQETDCGVIVGADREVGVASTKSFTAQVMVLMMTALWFVQNKKMKDDDMYAYYIDQMNKFVAKTPAMIEYLSKFDYTKIVKSLNNKSAFVLGKGKGLAIASEGALKIKELTYCHAEGYSYSSLKHGPLALIEKGTPVIFIAHDRDCIESLNNSAHEVKARLGCPIIVGCSPDADVPIFEENEFSHMWCNIAVQFMAYYLAIDKGINVDFPRNLAKVVTVL